MFKKWNIYQWLIKIFEKQENWNYNLTEEKVEEISFPISKIKKELLSQGFEMLEIIDYHFWKVTTESERVYFICKKI